MLPDSVAFFSENIYVYWHGILFAIAIASTIVLTYILRKVQGHSSTGVGLAAVIAMPLALLLGRVHYCFFSDRAQSGGFLQLGDLGKGGYGLFGAMLGVFIALVITCFVRKESLAEMLDAAAVAGMLGVGIGRAASYFSHEELGVIIKSEKWQFFPFAAYLSEDGHYHLAVFSFEVLAAIITLSALLFHFGKTYSKKAKSDLRKGDVFLLFGMMYCSSQTLLESWRTDSLFLNSLGFVRFSQAFAAILLCAAVIVAGVRYVKLKKLGAKQIWIWLIIAGLFAAAFVMEFRLTSGTLVRNYSVMFPCLLAICAIGKYMLVRSETAE